MKSLYETENATVIALLDERMDFYVVQLVGDVQRNHYKNAWESVLKDAKNNDVCDIIFNFKDMTTQPDAGRVWFSNEFLPRFSKIHPNMRVAVISPAISVLEQTFVPIFYVVRNFFVQFFKKKTQIQVRFFKKVVQAHDWFKPKNTSKYEEKAFLTRKNNQDYFENLFSQQNQQEEYPQKNTRTNRKRQQQEDEEYNKKFFGNSLFGDLERQMLENENRRKTKKKNKRTPKNKPSEITETQPKGFWGKLFGNLFFRTETNDDLKTYNLGNKKSGFSFKIHFSKKGGLK